METARRGEVVVYYIDGYKIGEAYIIIPRVKQVCVLPAHVEKAAPVHVVFVAELDFNVNQSPARQFRPYVEDA